MIIKEILFLLVLLFILNILYRLFNGELILLAAFLIVSFFVVSFIEKEIGLNLFQKDTKSDSITALEIIHDSLDEFKNDQAQMIASVPGSVSSAGSSAAGPGAPTDPGVSVDAGAGPDVDGGVDTPATRGAVPSTPATVPVATPARRAAATPTVTPIDENQSRFDTFITNNNVKLVTTDHKFKIKKGRYIEQRGNYYNIDLISSNVNLDEPFSGENFVNVDEPLSRIKHNSTIYLSYGLDHGMWEINICDISYKHNEEVFHLKIRPYNKHNKFVVYNNNKLKLIDNSSSDCNDINTTIVFSGDLKI